MIIKYLNENNVPMSSFSAFIHSAQRMHLIGTYLKSKQLKLSHWITQATKSLHTIFFSDLDIILTRTLPAIGDVNCCWNSKKKSNVHNYENIFQIFNWGRSGYMLHKRLRFTIIMLLREINGFFLKLIYYDITIMILERLHRRFDNR